MLSAMGFESGSGCGRRGQGISAPVHATARARLGRDRLGIGADTCRAGLGATADDAGGAAEGPAAPTRWVPAADVPPRAPGAPERRAFARCCGLRDARQPEALVISRALLPGRGLGHARCALRRAPPPDAAASSSGALEPFVTSLRTVRRGRN
ncbi:unnamed protein product, partial [Prorocentrum cordatum]